MTRALEIISEAVRRLPEDMRARYPSIDWPAIAAAGNIYRHQYDAVDEGLIWHTARHSLGELRDAAAAELRNLAPKP